MLQANAAKLGYCRLIVRVINLTVTLAKLRSISIDFCDPEEPNSDHAVTSIKKKRCYTYEFSGSLGSRKVQFRLLFFHQLFTANSQLKFQI